MSYTTADVRALKRARQSTIRARQATQGAGAALFDVEIDTERHNEALAKVAEAAKLLEVATDLVEAETARIAAIVADEVTA